MNPARKKKKAFQTTHVSKGNENIKNNIFLYGTINVIVEQMLYDFREKIDSLSLFSLSSSCYQMVLKSDMILIYGDNVH